MDHKILHTMSLIARAFWRSITLTLILSIGQTLVGNYTFVATQRLLDGLVAAAPQFGAAAVPLAALAPLLGVYIAANLINHILVYLSGVPSTMLNKSVGQWVKLRALEKIFHMDYLAYQDLGTGNLIQIVENGAEATRRILSEFYMGMVLRVAQLVIALFFIRTYDQTLFAIILAGYGVFYLFSYYLMRFLKRQVEKMLANQEDFSSLTVRAFMELVVFRVNGRFKAEYERVKDISDEIVRARTQVYLLQELSYTGFALLIFFVEAGVVIQQAGKILAGESTVGTLVALTGFIGVVFYPIIGFGQAWMQYRLDTVAYQRMDAVFSLPDDPGLSGGKPLEVTRGEVVFDHVTFAYPRQRGRRGDGEDGAVLPGAGAETGAGSTVELEASHLAADRQGTVSQESDRQEPDCQESARLEAGHEVVEDFSLTIAGGKLTALVGSSGSGKSTLIRLLLHLLKPQRGRVCVDGHDLAEANLSSYYRQVAYVPQEPPIFDGTLRENLTFGRAVDVRRVEEVIRQVGLAERVDRLPQGLETRVGERGIKLSGGERQRLAFGRVMLQDPRIVILDEPTSALDSVTEDRVTRHMAAFLRGRTVIIVAHRLQTVKSADTIVVLEQGQIVQQGRFETLVEQPGRFRELWEKQVRNEQNAEVG